MDQSSTNPHGAERIGALESIRGLASFQVLLLHTFSAFVPVLVAERTPIGVQGILHFTPLFLLYDGYSAVYVFFVLSGFVLTPLFARYARHPLALIQSRWTRLAAPAFAAALVALAIRSIVVAAPPNAGRVVGSDWLSSVWRPPAGAAYFLYDAFVQGPLTGYSQTSILTRLELPIPSFPIEQAYLAPFWTLSVELQGSMLVLGLTLAFRRSRKFWGASMAVASVLLFRTDFVCFLAGHLLARLSAQAPLRRAPQAALAGLASVGVALCVVEEFGFVRDLTSCRAQGLAWIPCSAHSLKMAGAILLFVVAIGSRSLADVLAWPPFVALGRISFSLYLVHWPIVVGAGSVLYLAIGRGEQSAAAAAVSVTAAVGLSLWCARLFSPIDNWAVSASRRIRQRETIVGQPRVPRPSPLSPATIGPVALGVTMHFRRLAKIVGTRLSSGHSRYEAK
jgi:peptidoglycan/LPS O-acetylase OafA/YrhL